MLKITCTDWHTNGEWARFIRRSVFVHEQGIPEHEEWDNEDASATHAVAWLGEQAVGTARLLRSGKIGRMAVLSQHRRQGIGAAMLQALLKVALEQGFTTVRLSAQKHAVPFYSRHGFEPDADPHIEVGIPHQWMCKKLAVNKQ
ncbi:MAG TPA: GNAT family N-acetyltransferase [Limnobacter sp.]|nr:GNAT family N-acetyltransferase [Limnobacter sp.]